MRTNVPRLKRTVYLLLVASMWHNHVSVNVSVTDTNGHMQYKSGQKHTQAITRVKEGYVPCQVTKKMTLNCMDGENGWT